MPPEPTHHFLPPDDGTVKEQNLRQVLVDAVRDENAMCARIADDLASRFQRSGRQDQAMVAIQLAAAIRARAPR